MFSGAITALVTPFKDGKVDFDKLGELVEFQIENGIDGILPAGCTGEAATLTHDEQIQVVDFVVKTANGRCKVIAGTGSNSTAEALSLTKAVAKKGADAALVITPYYNKPTPEGQYLHYKLLADEGGLPVILYNVPSRTGINMTPDTTARLSEVKNIVAIKEAAGSVDQVSQILSKCDITVLSGDDGLTLPMMSVGATGVISVVSNILPKETVEMVKAFHEGNLERSRELHFQLLPVVEALFYETNPMPVKTIMNLLGRLNGEVRLPLCDVRPETRQRLENDLKKFGLL